MKLLILGGTVFLGRYRVARARHRQSALRPVGHDHGGHPATGPHEWEAVAQVDEGLCLIEVVPVIEELEPKVAPESAGGFLD